MKAKSKVLLGLLVALAMMVLAVPAFAATTTFDVTLTPSKDEGLVVYTGNTGKLNIAIKDDDNVGQNDVYEIEVTDKYATQTENEKIKFEKMTLMGPSPSGDLDVPTTSTTKVDKHPVDITITKTKGEGQGSQTITGYVVDVKQNLGAVLSIENLKAAKSAATGTHDILARPLITGDSAEISVVPEKGSESDYKYQWQIAKVGADVTAAAYLDSKVFEDISGETGATLQKTVDIDDNGKFVRCIVTDSDGNKAVANVNVPAGTTDVDGTATTTAYTAYCVRLDVTDNKLVCASPTEDQDVSVIMTQTKTLAVTAKAGREPYNYKWKKDGVYLDSTQETYVSGETTANLVITGDADKEAEGDYVCEITDDRNSKVTSPVFHVTVADMPKLTLEPSVVAQKAEYNGDKTSADFGKPVDGNGSSFVATDDGEKPLTLTANIENPADVKSVKWETTADGTTWKSETQGPSTTFEVANPSAVKGVRATVEFKDIPCTAGTIDKALVYTTNIYVTDGSLNGNVYTYIGNDATKNEADKDPEFVVTLPEGVYWKTGADTNYAKNVSLTAATTGAFTINLPTTTEVDKAYSAVVTSAPTVGERTGLAFKVAPASYPVTVSKPYVKNMTVTIPADFLSDKHDGSGTHTGDVVLPVSDGVGYKIVRKAEASDLTLKKTSVPYNTKEQPAEVVAAGDAKIGEISEVRYMPKATALAGVNDGGTAVPFITEIGTTGKYAVNTNGFTAHPAVEKAFYAALTTDVPVDTGDYIVVCNVAASDELEKAENVLVPDVYTISPANTNTVEKDPETFFTWTKEKVYNGQDQDADVKFADGMTKAGKIKKVTYKTTDKNGVLVTVQPNAVGKYQIYVTTEADPEEVGTNENVGVIPSGEAGDTDPAYIGDFRITKLPLSKDLFKMDPTEADYTGNPIVPEITTDTAGVGKIAAVHYYPEGSEQELGSAPVAAGVYTVKIDVEEGENYEATKEPLEVGTLTINSQETNKPTLYMRGHVQNKGWDAELTEVKPGSETMIGTTGSALRVEAIDIVVPEGYTVGGFAHVQNEGDVTVTEVPADAVDYPAGVPEGYKVYRFGSTGKGQRLEAIQTEIKDASGALLEGLKYQVHVENKAWMGYVANGSFAGTRALGLRLEALRFAYEGTPAPTEPEAPAEPETPAEETPTNPAE
ncbi:MAG: hypothetical protein IJG85_00330 [Eubacteriaceae bacterium]|nr:hypothetical protein [Eubacteriaceae bacterium]